MAKYECPNDGPFDAEPETRTTTPVKIVHRTEKRKVVRTEASTGDPVVVEEEVTVPETERIEADREVTVAVCPTCGSPIVVEG
jgi:hypothetical protein